MKPIVLGMALLLGGTAAAAQDMQTAPPPPPAAPGASGMETPEDPRGGYAPAAPLFSAPPPPGAHVVFVPNRMTPTEAYPPPLPLKRYPVCKRGQYDNCRQRGG